MNKVFYPQNYFQPYEDFEDEEELNIEEKTDELVKHIINTADIKARKSSNDLFGLHNFAYMYGMVLQQLQNDLGDIVYENFELCETIEELRSKVYRNNSD